MRILQEFTIKSSEHILTEYETLAYEQICRMIEGFAKLNAITYEISILESERDYFELKKKHEQLLMDGDNNDTGASSTPVS